MEDLLAQDTYACGTDEFYASIRLEKWCDVYFVEKLK